MEEWKQRLRQAREEKGLNKTAFSKAVGVSNATVTDWEKSIDSGGIKELTGLNLTKVCAVLGITAEWLLHGKGPKTEDVNRAVDSTPSEADFALIPQLDVRASCGPGGKFHDHVVVKGGLAFKRSFLSEMGVSEQHARVVYSDGPSMEPTIGHGRVVLVNTADNSPKDGKVYLICDEDGGMILKRLVREYEPTIGTTAWKIRSDNPDKRKFPDKFWPEDTRACIVGRAIWHDGLL